MNCRITTTSPRSVPTHRDIRYKFDYSVCTSRTCEPQKIIYSTKKNNHGHNRLAIRGIMRPITTVEMRLTLWLSNICTPLTWRMPLPACSTIQPVCSSTPETKQNCPSSTHKVSLPTVQNRHAAVIFCQILYTNKTFT